MNKKTFTSLLLISAIMIAVACNTLDDLKPTTISTPFPQETRKTVIDGVVYDISSDIGKPIAGAIVSYQVVPLQFPELQEGSPSQTITDEQGDFSLPIIVHYTDNARILIEAQGFVPHEENLVGVDLVGGRSFVIGLTPVLKETDKKEPSFAFLSGGSYQPEGHGEWQFILNINGEVSIKHQISDAVMGEWNILLVKEENSDLWQMIYDSGLKNRASSTRIGVPDEVRFRFVLQDFDGLCFVDLWVNDAREDEGIVALVNQIEEVIEKYTHEQAILW